VATTPTKGESKMNKQIEKELAKVITKCLLNEGHDPKAIAFVLSKYDLTSYLLDEPLRIMGEQAEAVSKAMAI
jgi:hypothetical protein